MKGSWARGPGRRAASLSASLCAHPGRSPEAKRLPVGRLRDGVPVKRSVLKRKAAVLIRDLLAWLLVSAVLVRSAQLGAVSWPARLRTASSGAIQLVCHALGGCPPDGGERPASQLDRGKKMAPWVPRLTLFLLDRLLQADVWGMSVTGGHRTWSEAGLGHRCVPFLGGRYERRLCWPFPLCKPDRPRFSPGVGRAEWNTQPRHDLGGAFRGSRSRSVLSHLQALSWRLGRGRWLLSLTGPPARVLQPQPNTLRALGQGGGKRRVGLTGFVSSC